MIQPLRAVSAYRRLRRYRQVTFTFVRFGFDDLVDRVGPSSIWGRIRKRGARRDTPTPERLRLVLAELGPTFVKFGQVLSTRPDILPDKYIAELSKLQDRVPPFPIEEVRRIFREDLGKEPEALFRTFDPEPLASGSIAQVHRATLEDGTKVAVKVQRPHIHRQIETDISILEEITGLVERHIAELRVFRPHELVSQFARSIRRELDFVIEAQAVERFRKNFADDPTRFIPAVHWEHTTARILVTDFVEGVKVTDIESIEALGLDRRAIARNGARAILREVFEFRLFHADPHPGNFFVQDGNVIATVDFGIVGRLDDEMAEQLARVMLAVVTRDISGILRAFQDLGLLHEDVDRRLLKADVQEFVDRYYGLPLEKIDAEKIIEDMLRVVRRHRILLPVDLALLGRMLAVASGVGRMLNPEFDVIGEARPFVKGFLAQRMNPRTRIRRLARTWREYEEALRSFPADFEEIVAKLKKGEMVVSLHHEGLSRLILEMDRSSNRLAFGLIVAALIIGSSLVLQLSNSPTVFGLSALALGGYIAAGVLGLWLVIAILRSGRI
ncbi:MAG: AarF/ABC1/UbiB kinase family protein [Acidobacteriota bacterium]